MTETAVDFRTNLTKQLLGIGTRFAFNDTTPITSRRAIIDQLGLIAQPAVGVEKSCGSAENITFDFWTPAELVPGRLLLYAHGGGYTMFTPHTHQGLASRLAREFSAQALVFDYRLAPENKFPAAVEDALAMYRYALKIGYDPRNIIVAGDSAGGGITFALLLAARDQGLPMPGLAIGLSPWVDMTATGISMRENADKDVMLNASGIHEFATKYLGETDPKHPLVSPLFGDFAGLPPVMLQAAGDEILRDDAVRLAAGLRAAGIQVELDIWPGLFHVFEFAWRWLPQADEAIVKLGDFVRRHYSK